MGSLFSYGTKYKAPSYSSSSQGTPRWSQLDDTQFNDDIVAELKSFILYEAQRLGHNDFNNNRVGDNQYFFDVNFLGGWPFKLWSEMYHLGVSSHPKFQKINLG